MPKDLLRIICEEFQKFNEGQFDIDYFDDNNDSLADKMYNNSFGISTGDNNLNYGKSLETKGTFIGNIEDDYQRPVYLNPKTMEGFANVARGILMANGDFYVSFTNTYHAHILDLLENKGIVGKDVYLSYGGSAKDFVAVQRFAGSQYFKPSVEYTKNTYDDIEKIFDVGNTKHPRFDFTNPKYIQQNQNNDITDIINEELENWFDDEESLTDKYYNQKFGISTQQKNKELSTMGTLVGNLESNPDYPVFLNPEALIGFDSNCRGVMFANGNFYICKNSEIYHLRFFEFLKKKNLENVDPKFYYMFPDRYVAVARINNTNVFIPSETYKDESYSYIIETLSKNKNPNIIFQPQIYKRPAASKYEEKYTS